jgi:hypothetical protein
MCTSLKAAPRSSSWRCLHAARLKTAPNNRPGWRLLTDIDIALRGTTSAPTLWEVFLKRFPVDVPALRHLAQLHSTKRHEQRPDGRCVVKILQSRPSVRRRCMCAAREHEGGHEGEK